METKKTNYVGSQTQTKSATLARQWVSSIKTLAFAGRRQDKGPMWAGIDRSTASQLNFSHSMQKQPCPTVETKKHAVASQGAPHPGIWWTAGVLCQMRGLDADAVATQGGARSCSRNMVRVRILRMSRTEAEVCYQVIGHVPESINKHFFRKESVYVRIQLSKPQLLCQMQAFLSWFNNSLNRGRTCPNEKGTVYKKCTKSDCLWHGQH